MENNLRSKKEMLEEKTSQSHYMAGHKDPEFKINREFMPNSMIDQLPIKPMTTADFVIYKDGSNIVEVNGDTGAEYRNTNFSTVFAHAAAQITSGGHIHIKKGEYEYDADGILDDYNIVSGAGDATVLKCADATIATAFKATSKTGITIRNLHIDGNQSNQETAQFQKDNAGVEKENCGIRLDTCSQCKIYNVTVTEMPNIGIFLYNGCTECITQSCHVSTCYWHGVEYWLDIKESIVAGCILRDCYKEPVVVELGTTENCSIIGNVVSDDGAGDSPGIRAQTCNDVLIAGNVVISGAIRLAGATNCTIANNFIHLGGMTISAASHYAFICNNYIDSSTAHAMSLAGDYLSIINNYIFTAGNDAIYLLDVNYSLIAGNYLIDAVSEAIAEHATDSDNNEIRNNYISNCGSPPVIDISGASTNVQENIGYVTENEGVTGAVADGGTFAHGLVTTPTGCVITGTVAGDLISVNALGAANVTVNIKDEGGGAGTAQVLYFRAWV